MKYKPEEIKALLELKKDHCEACGTENAELDAHHWCHKGKANFAKPWNVATLCRRCHQFFHRSGAYDFIDTYPHLAAAYNNARVLNRVLDVYKEARK